MVLTRSERPRGRWFKWLVLPLVVILAGLALYTWLALSYSYSEGERIGSIQKVSRKGWLCKTDEGELAMYVVSGVSPQIWEFTVRDPAVAAQLANLADVRVRLHYREHRGLPSSCFGDTRYFVDSVTMLGSTMATPAPNVPVPPVPPTPRTGN